MTTYPVYLRDGVFQAVVYDFSETKLYDGVQIGAIAMACVTFAIFMLFYNRRITRAIVEISNEVRADRRRGTCNCSLWRAAMTSWRG